jgi:hypothetical protein
VSRTRRLRRLLSGRKPGDSDLPSDPEGDVARLDRILAPKPKTPVNGQTSEGDSASGPMAPNISEHDPDPSSVI